ncbi:MAG: hypothetical protein BWY19_00131 [bacterium ADurb.Bin212]|nr:MAG: hypothetical protein BWY19_00131 [bacterium ADurb.Bin212]
MYKIYLGLTTTNGSDWRGKTEEVNEFGLEEIALFPTVLEEKERQELYKLIEKSCLKSIPFVHLRHDMTEAEMDYLVEKWHTKVFNTHPRPDSIQFLLDNPKFIDMIAIENVCHIEKYFLKALSLAPRICLDLAHYQDKHVIQKRPEYKVVEKALRHYLVTCNHISAVKSEPFWEENTSKEGGDWLYECHMATSLSDFDYVKNYKSYLSNYCAIEISNTLKEQIKIKEHIERILA